MNRETMACVPSEDSNQPWHTLSLTRVSAMRLTIAKGIPVRYLFADGEDSDAEADESLRLV